MDIKSTRWDIIKSIKWDHLSVPWDDFLDSIEGSQKKNEWRDCKKEDAGRIVFVTIGRFVHLYHNDAMLCFCKFGFELMAGTEALTGFPITDLQRWKEKLISEGHTVIII